MRFKLFGTEVYISFLFCAVLCFMICFDRTGLIIPTLSAVALHETAHLFVMYLTDCAPVSVRLIPASVQIVKKPFISDGDSIKISIAGPLFNLCLGLTGYLNYNLYKRMSVLEFAAVNIIIAIFNLLPVSGLDGGDILNILLKRRYSQDKACRILRIITLVLSLLALCAGVYLCVNSVFNPSVFILSLYMFIYFLMGKQ